MSAAAPLAAVGLAAARALRGRAATGLIETAAALSRHPKPSSTRPFSSDAAAADNDQERVAAESSLYETGELHPRDFGYAHPRLEVSDGGGRDDGAGGKRIAVAAATTAGASSSGDGGKIPLGSTLLLARPLVFLDAPEDHQPRPEQLVNVLAMKRLWQTPAAAALQWDADPPAFARAGGGGAAGAAAAAAAAAAHRARGPIPPLVDLAAMPAPLREPAPLDKQTANEAEPDDAATSLVATNAFGDEYEDLPSAALRRRLRPPAATSPVAAAAAAAGAPGAAADPHAGPRAVAGVWPAFALLNHSCAPSCTHYVVGSTMVVRATADLGPGDDATVCYLGREAFAPADERRRALRERYGFECACPRCKAEDALPPAVRDAAAAARRAVVDRLRPRFELAVRESDGAAAAEVAAEVSALLRTLEEVLEKELSADAGDKGQKKDDAVSGSGSDSDGDEAAAQAAAALASGKKADVDGLAAQAVAYEAYELAYFASALAEASLGAGLEEHDGGQHDGGGGEGGSLPPQLAEGETAADRARRAQAYRGARHAATAALARCALVLDGVARGSEVHVLSAHALLRRAARAQRQASSGGAAAGAVAAADRMAEAAAAVVSGAHEARYGASRLPERVALGLLEASASLADEYF